ncbi:hypothetical protein AB205_0142230, partial [Aquarana catesbeiana]
KGFLFLPRSSVSEVSCNPDDVGKFIFEVIPGVSFDPNKPVSDGYTLMANSQTEMEEWVKAIKKAAGFPSGGNYTMDTITYLVILWFAYLFLVDCSYCGTFISNVSGKIVCG